MRRFELSDGKSSKFWQIDRSGDSFTVTSGKIGQAGQTQEKSFDSAARAQREHDKLVTEKVKKGYVEVGVAVDEPPAAPAAVATPAPADGASAELAAGVAWTAAAKREVAPRRGWDVVAPQRHDAKAAFGRIAAALGASAAALDRGERREDCDVARQRAARAAFAGEVETKLELEAQAAAFALVGPKLSYQDKARDHDFVRYWSAVEGGAFALSAYARGVGMGAFLETGPDYALKTLAVVNGPAPELSPHAFWWRTRHNADWRAVREALLLAGEAERPALEALAETLRQGASPSLRALLAAALERSDWAIAELDAALAATPSPNAHSHAFALPLVLLAPSAAEAQRYLEALAGPAWSLPPAIEALRYDLVAAFGAAAAPIFIDTLGRGGAIDADTMRALAEALALIVAPEVVRFFVRQLATKELRAIASGYLARHGAIAFVEVAQAAVGKGPQADAARALLRALLATQPEAASDKGALSPAAQALVEALERDAAPRAEAAPAELPRALREVPWRQKRVQPQARVVTDLPALEFEERMAWRKGEREALVRTDDFKYQRERDPLAAVRAANASDPSGKRSWELPNATLFAVLSPDDAVRELNQARLECFMWSYYSVLETLVARHGTLVLPGLLRFAAFDLGAAVDAGRRVVSPRMAPLMAEAFARLKKSRATAAEWLLAFPEAAAIGLVPLAVGAPGAAREHAEVALRHLASQGKRGELEAVAARYGQDAEAALAAVLDFDPLLVLPKKVPALPPFFAAGALSRPLLAGREKALPLGAVEALGTMLAFSPVDAPYAGLLEVKAACDPRSLADFAWDLFQAWLMAGAPAKAAWAFHALGLFGDDESARRLTPLIRAWPGEAAHARAVLGLEVLARIGTDVALMHLHGVAQKVKFKGLQEKAREKIDQIAEARGLSAEELADRLVPDLGLDDDGSLWLDFGARKFQVIFDESLKPAVRDEAGKRAADLPKPNKSDDGERAKAATERWKALKKDAKTIALGQLLRLELAMCSERRWSEEVWRACLLEHPLLVHLVRRLVWGVYADDGALAASFRVAEDRSLASLDDDVFTLPEGGAIGILHRLQAPDALVERWSQIFADYEILQPFEQLGRQVARPSEAEREADELARVKGLKVPTGKVLGLDARGWRRGPPQDGGVVGWYQKPVRNELVVSMDLDPGIYTGMISESPEQTLGAVTVGSEGGARWYGKQERVPFGSLPPVVFSELVRDLEALRG